MSCPGKELNPKSCIFVKECKPGYSRNTSFKCIKNKNAPKSRYITKETKQLLKDLFSKRNSSKKNKSKSKRNNSNNLNYNVFKMPENNLYNSPNATKTKTNKFRKPFTKRIYTI